MRNKIICSSGNFEEGMKVVNGFYKGANAKFADKFCINEVFSMNDNILDGKCLAEEIFLELKNEILKFKYFRKPKLVIILIGNNPASETYVRNKVKACEKVGLDYEILRFEENILQKNILNTIINLNKDDLVDGFIVQLPISTHLNVNNIIDAIDPKKDVDGLHPLNLGKMTLGLKSIVPATPKGIIEILKRYKIETEGKNCVVLGRSRIVGLPISILLSQNNYPGNCTVTMCNSKTQNLSQHIKNADILISAIGNPKFIKAKMIKQNCVIIDVGMNKIEDKTFKNGYKLMGDVDFENVKHKVRYITPVPGGVGPMTIASLISNTILAYKGKFEIEYL